MSTREDGIDEAADHLMERARGHAEAAAKETGDNCKLLRDTADTLHLASVLVRGLKTKVE